MRDRDLDAALDGVVDLLLARQAHAHAHRRDDLQLGVERADRDVEADLVVALAGAAVGDRVGALALRDLDQQLGDERPGERRGERDRRPGTCAFAWRLGNTNWRTNRSRPSTTYALLAPADDGRRSDALAQRAAADIHGQGDDLGVVLLAQPGDRDRCVQTARVGEDDLLHEETSVGMRRCSANAGVTESGMASETLAASAANRSSQRSRRGSSANRTRSVSSPASVPS